MNHQGKIYKSRTFTILFLAAHSYFDRAVYGVVYEYPSMKVLEYISLDGLGPALAVDMLQRLERKWKLSGRVDVQLFPVSASVRDRIWREMEELYG